MLETFLEAISWKTFQLFRHILIDVVASQRRPPFNADFSRGSR